MAHPMKGQCSNQDPKWSKRLSSGGSVKSDTPKAPEPLTIDPEGSLGRAMIKNRPMGTYKNIKWER